MRSLSPPKVLVFALVAAVGVFTACSSESPRLTVSPDAVRPSLSLEPPPGGTGYVYLCKDGPNGSYTFNSTATSGVLSTPLTVVVPGSVQGQLPCERLLTMYGSASDLAVTEDLVDGLVPTWQLYGDYGQCGGQLGCPLGDPVTGTSFSASLAATDLRLLVVRNVPGCTDEMADNYGEPGDCTYGPRCEDQNASNFGGPLPCVYPPTPCPAGSFTFFIDGDGNLQIRYDQFPAPNDNSYGVNAVGWTRGHKFGDLVGSDHAGVQLLDGSGTVRLSFNVDYLTANSGAPSGYRSLGVTGGDGKMLVGTADGISATTSLDRNLNNVNIPGLFSAAHVQQFGSVNVLVDSPPTDPAHTTYVISDPALAGWDFHNTYYVTISAAKLAAIGFNPATWQVLPNESQLHNSPAKACPPSGDRFSVTKYEVKDKQVKVTVLNSGSTDAILTALTLTWPSGVNGNLMQIKLDGDVIYNGPAIAGGSANLGTAQLVSDQNKRKINHNSSDVYTLIFQNNADKNLANYAGTVSFGSSTLTVLPP